MKRALRDKAATAGRSAGASDKGRDVSPKAVRKTRVNRSSETPGHDGDESTVVPVVAEELRVGKRTVETGRVRITKQVREEEEIVDQPTRSEEVVVERVPINQVVAAPPAPRQEGDTMIFPVLEEVVVIERRLMLKEEVRITTRVSETRHPQTVTLRSEDVKIERVPPSRDAEGT